MKSSRFQSSPVPKDGCNPTLGDVVRALGIVSILTRPEGRVQRCARSSGSAFGLRFQSSPVPKDGCNLAGDLRQRRCGVSILTRPEGRVQPEMLLHDKINASLVSILTRPEGRVQLDCCWLVDGKPSWVSILTRPEGRVQQFARDAFWRYA